MTRRIKTILSIAILTLATFTQLAYAGRSQIENGYLVIPRIDVDGYGALELTFRIEFDGQYVFILEQAVAASLAVSNSGVFDPVLITIDIDEIELATGDLYSAQLGLVSNTPNIKFNVLDAVHLNPAPPSEPSPAAVAMFSQQCSNCHGTDGAGTGIGPSLLACANCGSSSALNTYIFDTMPLGSSSSCDADCASMMAEYILDVLNESNEELAGQTVGFIQTLTDSDALRKASQQLLSRLPTLEEYQLVSSLGTAGVGQAIDGMMEEDNFYARLMEIFNDYLLTDKYHSRNGSEAAISLLSSSDFPTRRWFDPEGVERPENYSEIRANTNNGVAREPLALINYVVKNNRPFTEILTAGYMMMSPFSAKSYGINNLQFQDPDDPNEFLRVVLADVPHAGILTSPMFLNRYPTTSTNRNRGRSRVVFDLFLNTDILAIEGVRPGNSVDISTPIPTINNPECSKCHAVLDPVASIFQNWDYKGRYRPARLDDHGWYTDMETRGFNGVAMPLAGNVDSSVQWLAQQIAADPRFPKAIMRILVNGLTGKEPLQSPDSNSASQAAQDAYIAERTLLNDIQASFVDDSYNLKTLVREILLSPYWRAEGLASGANMVAHAQTGSSYLLSPEQLDRKIMNLFGFDWRGSLDNYYKDKDRSYASKLNNTFHQIYGGIDSDGVTSRLKSPNGLMGSMQIRMANEMACYAVPYDFWLPQDQRKLFLFVDHEMSPYNDTGVIDDSVMNLIRQNIQFLHEYLLGEKLSLGASELQISEQLFMGALNRGRQIMLNNGSSSSTRNLPYDCDRTRDFEGVDLVDGQVNGRLVEDRQYVIRSWMAVVAYLLADYKFLYN